jgi:hypothetical protein
MLSLTKPVSVNPDPIGIYLDGVQYAVDTSGHRITAKSEYLTSPVGITEPNNPSRSTAYDRSSPPLIMGLPAAPGEHTMIFAICDANNGLLDSGLMVKAGACVDCDADIRINYATTTTTVGPTPFVRTIQASGTVSGTVVYGEPEGATTTTTEEVGTSTEVTATTAEAITSSEGSTTATTTQSTEVSSNTELSSTTHGDLTSTQSSESLSWSDSSTPILTTTTSEEFASTTGMMTTSAPSTTTMSTQGGFTTIRRGCRP